MILLIVPILVLSIILIGFGLLASGIITDKLSDSDTKRVLAGSIMIGILMLFCILTAVYVLFYYQMY